MFGTLAASRRIATALRRILPSSFTSSGGVMPCATIQSLTRTWFLLVPRTAWAIMSGRPISGITGKALLQSSCVAKTAMMAGPTNCPRGKPMWWVPTANPRFSFCHHSPTIATFAGSPPPRLMPMTTGMTWEATRLDARAKVPAPPRSDRPMAMTHAQERRQPLPTTSDSRPKKKAPATVPTKSR